MTRTSSQGPLVDRVIAIAQMAIPLLPFGGPGLIIARAVIDSIKMSKETQGLSEEQIAALDESRGVLELAVNEHAKRVAARLLG
jgi:hypothetical protein